MNEKIIKAQRKTQGVRSQRCGYLILWLLNKKGLDKHRNVLIW